MPPVTASAKFSPEALISLRKSQGLTRSQLARMAELNRTQLWRIETRVVTPYDSTIGRLAAALRVQVRDLYAAPDAP